jgi:hypothetical protein
MLFKQLLRFKKKMSDAVRTAAAGTYHLKRRGGQGQEERRRLPTGRRRLLQNAIGALFSCDETSKDMHPEHRTLEMKGLSQGRARACASSGRR